MYYGSSQWPADLDGQCGLRGADSVMWRDGNEDGIYDGVRTWADEDRQNFGGGMNKYESGCHYKPYSYKKNRYCCCVCRCCYWNC